MGNMLKGFFLMMGQILKKVINIAVIAGLLYAGWLAFKVFTQDASKRAKATATKRLEKQGLDAKE